MAYTRQARASALRIVAAQGYHIAAGLTGISETSLRRWAADQAEGDHVKRERGTTFKASDIIKTRHPGETCPIVTNITPTHMTVNWRHA